MIECAAAPPSFQLWNCQYVEVSGAFSCTTEPATTSADAAVSPLIVTGTGLFTATVRSVGFASKVLDATAPSESCTDAVTSMVVSAPWSVNSWSYDGPVSMPPSGWR